MFLRLNVLSSVFHDNILLSVTFAFFFIERRFFIDILPELVLKQGMMICDLVWTILSIELMKSA